jgi:hypothetical protein
MRAVVFLVALGGMALTGLLAYLAYLRAGTKRAAAAALRGRVAALERENVQLRELVTALRIDALRMGRDEPILANQVENRITTHPLFREQISRELEP